MQNVMKRKNMYLEGFQVILNFYHSKSYVLDHLDVLCISKNDKKKYFLSVSSKIMVFGCTGGGGSYGRVRNC